jgi:serine/threonine protein kinase
VTLSDGAIERLRRLPDVPDTTGTRYEIAAEIGRGGMGIVYRARDRELDRDVAFKVPAWKTDSDTARLRHEARTLASLEHAGIVPVHDIGRLPDGRLFLVMALVDGERLDRHASRLPLADRLRVFDRICDTVAFAHARGVVHRDLKPANILVSAFGQVQIVDWGLAVPSDHPPPVPVLGGTSGYMAPEQSANADARVDVYALGAILADLIGGGGAPAVVPPATPPSRLRPLYAVAARARSADPDSRYETVAQLAMEVRRFVDGHAVLAHDESAIERLGRLTRTYKTPLVLVLTYLAVRVLLLLWPR